MTGVAVGFDNGTNANRLYAVTLDKVARIAEPGGTPNTDKTAELTSIGADVVVAGNGANTAVVVATPDGLKVFDQDLTEATGFVDGIEDGLWPIELAYVSDLGARPTYESTVGNLYVLAVDSDNDKAKVYRYYVNAGTGVTLADRVKPVGTVPVTDFGGFRRHFATDGSVMFSADSRSVEQQDLLRVGVGNESTGLVSPDSSLTDKLDVPNSGDITTRIARPVREPASGAWIVPVADGVRVNE